MKIAAIIAEFNPFHKGHLEPIRYAREVLHADAVVILMSGDFVQRGEPALFDKFTRSEMALLMGADLVLELPPYTVLSSAQYYAEGAIRILREMPQVTHLVFGMENVDPTLLSRIIDTYVSIEDDEAAIAEIRSKTEHGQNYAAALTDLVIKKITGYDFAHAFDTKNNLSVNGNTNINSFSAEQIRDILSRPNNILGIQYMLALRKANLSIEPVPIQRIGGAHNEEAVTQEYASATAIRRAIIENGVKEISDYIPEPIWDLYEENVYHHNILTMSDLDALMIPVLNQLDTITGFDQKFIDRIQKFSNYYTGLNDLAERMKSKDTTLSGIKRELMKLLLTQSTDSSEIIISSTEKDSNMDTEKYHYFIKRDLKEPISYLRVLGSTKTGVEVFREAHRETGIPVITSPGSEKKLLSDFATHELEVELQISNIARLLRQQKSKIFEPHETLRPFQIRA